MRARRIGAMAAILLLCAASGAGAQSRAPGSVDPPTATAPPSTETVTPAEEAKPAKKSVRHHRRWRHRGYARPLFLVPPPRYWFRPLPHTDRHRGYRYHRWHRGCRPWFLFWRRC